MKKTAWQYSAALAVLTILLLIQPADATINTSQTFTNLHDNVGTYFNESQSVSWTFASGSVYAVYSQAAVTVTNNGVLNCNRAIAQGNTAILNSQQVNISSGSGTQYPVLYYNGNIPWISGSPNDYVEFLDKFVNSPDVQTCGGTPPLEMGGVVGYLFDDGTWNWNPSYGGY